jgi:hypothetical protein
MGLITQNYRVMEASSAPVEDSWYIGRDIGKVGFYTGVRVFDTPGLFTPDVVKSESWKRRHQVDDALVRAAFARRPVAAELLDEWTAATGAEQAVLAPFHVVVGSRGAPVDLVQSDREPPLPAEILRRYEQSLAKFPRWFYLQTLYGEGVGAAMHKRVRIVRDWVFIHELDASASPPDPGTTVGAGARLANDLESLGCKVAPTIVSRGGNARITCWWRVLKQTKRSYNAFIHFEEEHGVIVFHGDHPAGGLRPSTQWKPGELVRDDVDVIVPEGIATGDYKIFFGMWDGDGRPAVTPLAMSDGKDRIAGGVLIVE